MLKKAAERKLKMNTENLNENYTPTQYFDYIKTKKNNIDDEKLSLFYDNCLILLNKYNITGQKSAMKKLLFQIETVEKEREIVKLGIDTFVYKDDIEYYIDNVDKNIVKIIELENYEREIPDDIVQTVEQTKDIFDRLYVVFTDYTGKVERQVAQKRRDKDPILFGTFQNEKDRIIVDRFYYLGDWIDEYCDLTLDKMIKETKIKNNKNIEMKISTPEQLEELKENLKQLEPKNNSFIINNSVKKQSFFQKIKSVLK